MKNLFETEDDIKKGIYLFEDLANNEGWKLLNEVVKANIEVLKDTIINGIGEETIEDVNRLRDRLKVYQEVLETPERIATQLKQGDLEEESFDPYESRIEKEE